jgi:hypothetical protein
MLQFAFLANQKKQEKFAKIKFINKIVAAYMLCIA